MKNCWEIQECGRQPGGENVDALGVCPASIDEISHGLNRGVNAGRLCWAVDQTLCGGEVQGRAPDKQGLCFECDVFHRIVAEEDFATLKTMRPGMNLRKAV